MYLTTNHTHILYISIYIYTYTYNNLRWKMRWLVGDWRPPLSLRRIRDASRHSCAGHRNAIVDVCFKVGVVSLIHGFDYMDVLKCMTPSNADTTCRHNMSHCREFVELFLVFPGEQRRIWDIQSDYGDDGEDTLGTPHDKLPCKNSANLWIISVWWWLEPWNFMIF